jgi:hypothetical protein
VFDIQLTPSIPSASDAANPLAAMSADSASIRCKHTTTPEHELLTLSHGFAIVLMRRSLAPLRRMKAMPLSAQAVARGRWR